MFFLYSGIDVQNSDFIRKQFAIQKFQKFDTDLKGFIPIEDFNPLFQNLLEENMIEVEITIDNSKNKLQELQVDKFLSFSAFLSFLSIEINPKLKVKVMSKQSNQLSNFKIKNTLNIPYEHTIFNIYKDQITEKISNDAMYKLCYDYGIYYTKEEFQIELKSKSINDQFIIYTEFMLWWRHHKQLRYDMIVL